MEFTNFTVMIKEAVEKKMGEEYSVKLSDVRKNNGILLRGLTVMQNSSNISPTIYLNPYYDKYEEQSMTATEIVRDVMENYEKNKVNRSVDIRFFMDYQCIKGRIVYKLIHTERNKELLKDVPHIPLLDLSIVFQCLVSEEMFGSATILIHNVHIKLWDISEEELYQQASYNTQRLQQYEIANMKDVICELLSQGNQEDDLEDFMSQMPYHVPMYVLSNRRRVHGASCILYPDLLTDFSESVKSSFFVLPSSVHEVILLPEEGEEDINELKQMVKEINETQLACEEVLSDSVYYFDRDTHQLSLL